MLKKLSGIIVSVGLASVVCLNAFCLSASRFVQDVKVSDNSVKIICSTLDYGEVSVALGGTPLSAEISTTGESNVPVTVYCLADVSNSISDSMMEQEKQVLLKISELMREGDSMIIAALGNSTSQGEPLTTPEERATVIENLNHGNYNTNLYAGIVDSLNNIQTDSTINEKCCLVILSDGKDEYKAGITENEVNSAIKESRVPIYTVAVLPKNYNSTNSENAKALGSFARSSAGGIHFAPLIDNISAEDVGSEIWDDIMNGTVVTASLDGFTLPDSKSDISLKVTYTSGNVTVEDSIDVTYDEIAAAMPEPEEESVEVPEPDAEEDIVAPDPEPAPEPEPPDEKIVAIIIAIVAAAVVLIAAIVIAIILITGKKKKQKQEELIKQMKEEQERLEKEQKKKEEEINRLKPDVRPVACVQMIKIGSNSPASTFDLCKNRPVTIGRNPAKANIVPSDADSKISGIHCSLRVDGKEIYIKDEGSTNGTYINGTRLVKDELRKLDIDADIKLTIGTFDYRLIVSFY